jgi:outer membrane lipoprotein LolB
VRAVRSRLAAAVLGFCLVSVFSACTTVTTQPVALKDSRDRLLALARWRLDGRIAVRTPSEGLQADLHWEHDKGQDRLQVSGPFSQGAVSIVLQQDFVLIRGADGIAKSSSDAADLLRRELGFAVPLSSLRYWVLGVSSPRLSSDAAYDASGQLRRLRQGGWSLDYERFVQVQDLLLPKKMSVQGGDVKLKLFVDEWTVAQ